MQQPEIMQVLYIFAGIFACLTGAVTALVSALIYFTRQVAQSVGKVPDAIGEVKVELKKQTTKLDSIEDSNGNIVKQLAAMKLQGAK